MSNPVFLTMGCETISRILSPLSWRVIIYLMQPTHESDETGHFVIRNSGFSHLFGLAPGGVFHAFNVAIEAVSSYLAFSPLLKKPERYIFCGTVRHPDFGMPSIHSKHRTLWSSDFPPIRIIRYRRSPVSHPMEK